MASSLPPHLQSALEHLSSTLASKEGRPLDLLHAPWAELEKTVIKALGGAFNLQKPEHQAIALGLAGIFGERLTESDRGFWFPNRESPEAAMLGFADTLLMLSPFGAVLDALSRSKLTLLDDIAQDIRKSLAQTKFSIGGQGTAGLSADDYRRLFDPGFVQFIGLDPKRLQTLFDARPDALARDLRDAVARCGKELAPEARQQFDQQITGALTRLDASQPLKAQVAQAPRLVELMIHLFATSSASGSAPEEFWTEAILPMLFIGTPTQFPPLDDEELEAVKQGADPLALFLDLVPYQQPAPEEGLLGVFDIEDISLPHDDLGQAGGAPRLLQLKREGLQKLLATFDPKQTQNALTRFTTYLGEKSGSVPKASEPGQQMAEAAVMLLSDLKRVVEQCAKDQGALCMRRLTEAEATSDSALAIVRRALQGPRIILSP